jgi:hypothetical protein
MQGFQAIPLVIDSYEIQASNAFQMRFFLPEHLSLQASQFSFQHSSNGALRLDDPMTGYQSGTSF